MRKLLILFAAALLCAQSVKVVALESSDAAMIRSAHAAFLKASEELDRAHAYIEKKYYDRCPRLDSYDEGFQYLVCGVAAETRGVTFTGPADVWIGDPPLILHH